MHSVKPPSFDEMAVALSMVAACLRLDIEQTEILGARIDLSPMGIALAVSERQKNLDLIVHLHRLLKDAAPVETEVRAMVLRKKNGRWAMFARVAAI